MVVKSPYHAQLRGHYNKPEALIYWEELWETVLLWMLERNEEADERVEQMRGSGYYEYNIEALLYCIHVGKSRKVAEVLEQILKESKYTYDYECIYSREQRAKRTCWHVHLSTAARV